MRLYVICKHCGRKIYLNMVASSRREIAQKYGKFLSITCRFCHSKNTYSVNEIFAEPGVSNVPAGAIGGGLVGLLGGPLGILIGGGIGALIGGSLDAEDVERANRFNGEEVE